VAQNRWSVDNQESQIHLELFQDKMPGFWVDLSTFVVEKQTLLGIGNYSDGIFPKHLPLLSS